MKNNKKKNVVSVPVYGSITDEDLENLVKVPDTVEELTKDKSGVANFYKSLRYPDRTTEIETP